MKLSNESPRPEAVEIADVKPVKKELKFLGSLRPHRGHTLYEIDIARETVTEATFESVTATYTGERVSKRVIAKEGCVYISALNRKNAAKKYLTFMINRKK